MEETKTLHQCLNCNRPETVVPLINLRYVGKQTWICTQCFPSLIHEPQQLAGKLAGIEKITPAPPREE